MSEYSVEEVRAISENFRQKYPGPIPGILNAYADLLERIKADERAVPVATDAQVEAIIKSVHSGYGIDESSWSQLLVRAALESKAVAQPLPMGKDGDGVVPALWIEFTDDGQNIRLWTRNGQQAAEEIREGRKLLAFYARPPSQAMNEQSGISGQLEFRKGLLEGLSMAKSECDNRVFALDGGDNQFRREATASQCAEAIRLVYARMFREMTAMPATRPPAQSAQAALSEALNALEDAAVNGHKLLGDDALRFRALVDRIAPTAETAAQGEVVDIDTIALQAAEEIALIWGQDRSQFVAKIQVRIIAALQRVHAAAHFRDTNALAEWLESLHECHTDGAVGNRKWEPAQIAAKAVRESAQPVQSVDVMAVREVIADLKGSTIGSSPFFVKQTDKLTAALQEKGNG